MKKYFIASLLFVFLLIAWSSQSTLSPSAAVAAEALASTNISDKNAPKSEELDPKMQNAKAQLSDVAKAHVAKAQKNIRPNIETKEVIKNGDNYTCRYITVDPESLDINISASNEPKITYMGQIIYLEHIYEATAPTQKEAMNGNFEHVKTRRITELARYHQGKWLN